MGHPSKSFLDTHKKYLHTKYSPQVNIQLGHHIKAKIRDIRTYFHVKTKYTYKFFSKTLVDLEVCSFSCLPGIKTIVKFNPRMVKNIRCNQK